VGCYEYLQGVIAGGSEGRVLKAELLEQNPAGPQKLIGLFTFTSDSKRLVGLVRNADSDKGSALYSFYTAERISTDIGECPQIAEWSGNVVKSQIATKLERDGRARLDGINFDFNSNVIRVESKPLLDSIAAILKEHGDWQVTLEGHTDNIGGAAFNNDLSARRAAAVKAYLANAGVPVSRLASIGFGFEKPVSTNDTQSGRAENRRVEIVRTAG
jgi:outer membrane protein OmpA-like peptidoglycan-associated protein